MKTSREYTPGRFVVRGGIKAENPCFELEHMFYVFSVLV